MELGQKTYRVWFLSSNYIMALLTQIPASYLRGLQVVYNYSSGLVIIATLDLQEYVPYTIYHNLYTIYSIPYNTYLKDPI